MWIKICGLSTDEAVKTAVENGASHIGFVFAKSKRQVTPEQARQLSKDVPKSVKKVGLFVNASLDEIAQTIKIAGLDMVQLHGDESIAFANQIAVPVIKAFGIKNGKLPSDIAAFKNHVILLDAPPAQFAGGSGQQFEWEKVALSKLSGYQFFVAGGLNPDNVSKAISFFQPTGVDVSSGVETDGKKDVKKISLFLENSKKLSTHDMPEAD
ncbi:phosphoribosylanthranilate isomerase [Pseudolactococcus plantarum]|uniref:phosphoribosylanthranilate isomerase n=1 Tax=Pseudolactococcus plantarum TaxID=1365 RepID=UPI00082FDCFC|nr:phosphoribosylanthranilate isomerase [Lactococcus plantarum]HCN74837.1 phosphoribosylanthranilate isomerase [Lactococcus sp.]